MRQNITGSASPVLAEILRRNLRHQIDPLEYPGARCTFCGSDAYETPLMTTDDYGVICIDHARCAQAQALAGTVRPAREGD